MSVKNNKVKNTLNLMRHSERSEESMDPSVGYASLKDDNRMGQRGRSMVEMLGVLAIVGVLSVGGVYGYGVAMKKHKANELLHQASIHAATVSAQIMSGKTPSNIQNLSGSSANFSQEVGRPNSDQFVLTAKDVDSAVCEQMQAMKGSMVREVVCGETDANGKTSATLTYNNDLSKNVVAADYNDDTTGEKCEGAGYKWCTELSTPVCKKDCCEGITLNDCQESCDSNTGAVENKLDATECTAEDGQVGTCNAGVCKIITYATDEECWAADRTWCSGMGENGACIEGDDCCAGYDEQCCSDGALLSLGTCDYSEEEAQDGICVKGLCKQPDCTSFIPVEGTPFKVVQCKLNYSEAKRVCSLIDTESVCGVELWTGQDCSTDVAKKLMAFTNGDDAWLADWYTDEADGMKMVLRSMNDKVTINVGTPKMEKVVFCK